MAPEFTAKEKMQLVWQWVLKNSQSIFLPQDLGKSYMTLKKYDITCIKANIDSRPFEDNLLLGREKHLLHILVWFSHHVYTGLRGEVFHRTQVGTAAQVRSSQLGIFIPNAKKITQFILR